MDGNNNNLASTQSSYQQWDAGLIPADCKSIAQNEGKDPNDFEIYNVTYTDVRHFHYSSRCEKSSVLTAV
jgi:hypothetical protein